VKPLKRGFFVAEIWIVSQYAVSPDLPGSSRHFELAREWIKAGHQVSIFCSNVHFLLRKQIRNLSGELCQEEFVEGVRFVWIRAAEHQKNDWRRVFNMLSFSHNFLQVAAKQHLKPEVIVGSSPNLFAAMAAWTAAWRKDAKFIFEIRDPWPEALIDMGMSRWNPGIVGFSLMAKWLYNQADHIVVLSDGVMEKLKNKAIGLNKLSCIPNGVDIHQFISSFSREDARAEFGFQSFEIVYAGAHGPANSLHTVLKAADFLRDQKDIQIVLVGDGPEKEKLKRQAMEMELPNVVFFPPVPKHVIPKLLCAADACLITLMDTPAFRYGVSPNKLFDYFAAGRPVVGSLGGWVADIIESEECGFSCSPENSRELADSIRKMYDLSLEERMAMGKNGQSLAIRRFSRDALAQEFLGIIEEVVKEKVM
jgi:glycosyltransferase involved in cell wall biosynthesis